MATHAPGFLNLVNEVKKQIEECSVEDVLRWQTEKVPFVFVDCREDNEWLAGRAKGAIHLGKGIIERDIESTIPDKDTRIVVYCGGGFRSALAVGAIQSMGYRKAISMDGGIRAWRDRGLPEERG